MRLNLNIYTVFMALILLLCSCTSAPDNKMDSVFVMVYDYENNELMDVSILIDGKEAGRTDIYGRLLFPCDVEKETAVTAQKRGYETVEITTMVRAGTLLYFRMGSGNYYAELAEKLLDENELHDALKMIDKSLEIEERKDRRYLREVILRRMKND